MKIVNNIFKNMFHCKYTKLLSIIEKESCKKFILNISNRLYSVRLH